MHDQPAYVAESQGIVVRVRPNYLAGQSDPAGGRWVWAYQVEIENLRPSPVQLVSRRWTITDGLGREEVVEGPGVVGEQPVIGPGDRYHYASGCPLSTPSGAMVGAYRMRDLDGGAFDAAIPAFSLDVPGGERTLN